MLGIDIVSIARIRRLVEKYGIVFLQKFLNENEIKLCQLKLDSNCAKNDSQSTPNLKYNIYRIAGFFALKEAIAKSLGCGIGKKLAFSDIKLSKNKHGAPKARLKKRAKKYFKVKKIAASISHEKDFAIAIAQIIFTKSQ